MKTITNQMRLITICFMLTLCCSMYCQNGSKSKGTFVRVYNLEGKKISKGYVYMANDSMLVLKKRRKQIEIEIQDIGQIKTKRSEGYNVLTGTIIGATTGAILGVLTADSDAFLGYSGGEGALGFGTIGAIGGAAIGGISIAFKKSETYIIEGDIRKWKLVKEMIAN